MKKFTHLLSLLRFYSSFAHMLICLRRHKDTLLHRMETHHRTFQTTLRQELEQIERAFIEERTEIIDSNVREADGLVGNKNKNEGKYMQERFDRIDDHTNQLEALRVHDAEEYNMVKIKLETDVQVLEQQLQQVKSPPKKTK